MIFNEEKNLGKCWDSSLLYFKKKRRNETMSTTIKKPNDLVIENARILYRNFKGEESAYNRKGDRNFCVIIDDPEFAKKLIKDGWNIKYTNPKEDSDYEPVPYLPVRVNIRRNQKKENSFDCKHRRISGLCGDQICGSYNSCSCLGHWRKKRRQGISEDHVCDYRRRRVRR